MAQGQSAAVENPPTESYPVPPEAQRQAGVPEGRIDGPFELSSSVFPGTVREYWIYVPAQYAADKPACTMIVQDGLKKAEDWRLPQICDNLIHAKEMPVTLGIFVAPGIVPAAKADAQPRFNRSFEYDSLGDRYARFLLEELLPEVTKSYNLSTSPNDRMLAGSSSGGICAFNAAWERPDAFHRVLSTVGTFVGLRGANELPVLVRKTEPKPLRVFLQDGSNDLDIYAGDWWVANQDMLSALTWAGYDVQHIWGDGGHNSKHSAAIMPDALRWLWRDYPASIGVPSRTSAPRRIDLFVPDSRWETVSSGHESAAAPTCSASGELFFCDSRAGRIYRVGEDGKTRIFADQTGHISSMAFGPNDKLYACKDHRQIIRFDSAGIAEVLIPETSCETLITMPKGLYYADSKTPAVWFSTFDGVALKALTLTEPVSALAPTTDHAFMHLISSQQQFTMHARIAADATLEHRQRYGFLHMPYLERMSGATAVVVDEQSRPIVATTAGLQVLDQLGRVNLILNKPSSERITGIAFGGAARNLLYVTAGDSVYRRLLNTRGVASASAPMQPPKPQL